MSEFEHDSIELAREARDVALGMPDRALGNDPFHPPARIDCPDGCSSEPRIATRRAAVIGDAIECGRCGLHLVDARARERFDALPRRYEVGYAMLDGNTYPHTKHRTLAAAQTIYNSELAASDRHRIAFFVSDSDDYERGDVGDAYCDCDDPAVDPIANACGGCGNPIYRKAGTR